MVIVAKLDRFFRSQRHLYATLHLLEQHGVGLVSVSETFDTTAPVGRAMLGMLGAFAQLERDTFIERSMDGTGKAVASGRFTAASWRMATGMTTQPGHSPSSPTKPTSCGEYSSGLLTASPTGQSRIRRYC